MLRISEETFDEIKVLLAQGTDPVQEGKLVKSKLTNLLMWKCTSMPDMVTDFYHSQGARSLLPSSETSSTIDEAEQQRLATIWDHFSSMEAEVEKPSAKQHGSGVSGAGRICILQSEQTLPLYATQTARDMQLFCRYCQEFGHSTNCCENAVAAKMLEVFAGQTPQVQRALLSFLQ